MKPPRKIILVFVALELIFLTQIASSAILYREIKSLSDSVPAFPNMEAVESDDARFRDVSAGIYYENASIIAVTADETVFEIDDGHLYAVYDRYDAQDPDGYLLCIKSHFTSDRTDDEVFAVFRYVAPSAS